MTQERLKELLYKAIRYIDDQEDDGYFFLMDLKEIGINREEFKELFGEEYASNVYDWEVQDEN